MVNLFFYFYEFCQFFQSSCLDSGSSELFVSHGRKKRSISTVEEEKQTAETLSAIIRVLAEGEAEDEPDNFYKNTTGFVNHNM